MLTKKRIKWLSLLLFIGATLILNKVFNLNQYFTRESLQPLFEQNIIVMGLGYILLFSLGNILLIPGWIFLAASVYALGTLNGFFLTLVAAYISVVLGFFVIRFIGEDALQEVEKPFVKNMLEKVNEKPFRVVFILRLLFQTAPFLNYTLALSGVSFRQYLLGSLFALPPVIFLYAYFIEFIVEKLG